MAHFNYLPEDLQEKLASVANRLVQSGKGILAADETNSLMEDRFLEYNLENNPENRRVWRQLVITTASDISIYISGIILTEETFLQKTDDGKKFRKLIKENGIIVGIQIDKGLVPLFGTYSETTTQGLDNLAGRCEEYANNGVEFAKWRCALSIGDNIPSPRAINENANVLGRFAAICQSKGLVPMVEPDISIVGDHGLERSQNVAEAVLAATFKALHDHHVYLEGIILKTNMILPGDASQVTVTPQNIAEATVATMRRCVPPSVPGITFLSGGQSEEMATINLNEINKIKIKNPWACTFAYDRTLHDTPFHIWAQTQNTTARFCTCRAQERLIYRCRANSDAAKGQYVPEKIKYF